jgi:hypothetical protein
MRPNKLLSALVVLVVGLSMGGVAHAGLFDWIEHDHHHNDNHGHKHGEYGYGWYDGRGVFHYGPDPCWTRECARRHRWDYGSYDTWRRGHPYRHGRDWRGHGDEHPGAHDRYKPRTKVETFPGGKKVVVPREHKPQFDTHREKVLSKERPHKDKHTH